MFVPTDFAVPTRLAEEPFVLVPLGPEHNDRTPGFAGRSWPRPMTRDDNLGDLVRHAEDFRKRTGFTYTVLNGDDVIGCVYIYPSERPGVASVRSWVREDRAHLDKPL